MDVSKFIECLNDKELIELKNLINNRSEKRILLIDFIRNTECSIRLYNILKGMKYITYIDEITDDLLKKERNAGKLVISEFNELKSQI